MSQNIVDSKKRIAKNTGLLYIRQLFVLSIALYTSRLTLQALGVEDFGIYAAVGGVTALLNVLTNSMTGAIQRFITFAQGNGDILEQQKVYSTSLLIQAIIAAIFVVLVESLGLWLFYHELTIPDDRLDVAFWVFQISVSACVVTLINVPNNASVIAHEDMGIFAFLAIVDAVLRCGLVALLFILPWDRLLMYAVFLFFIQFITASAYCIFCQRKYPEVKLVYELDRKLVTKLFSFAGWTIVYNLSTVGFIQGVNLLLNMFFGPILNAAYTIAMQAYSGIRSFCSSFQLASNPQIVKLYSQNQFEPMHKLVFSVCKISFFLLFFLSFPFILNSEWLLNVWLDEVPEHSVNFFCLLIIYAYIDVLAYPMDVAAQATGNIRRHNILSSIAILLTLPISYVLYTIDFIPEVVYMVAIVMSFIGIAVRVYSLGKLINLKSSDYIRYVVLRMVIVALIAIVPPILSKHFMNEGVVSVIVSFVVSFVSIGGAVYYFGLIEGERCLIKEFITKIRNKVRF